MCVCVCVCALFSVFVCQIGMFGLKCCMTRFNIFVT